MQGNPADSAGAEEDLGDDGDERPPHAAELRRSTSAHRYLAAANAQMPKGWIAFVKEEVTTLVRVLRQKFYSSLIRR